MTGTQLETLATEVNGGDPIGSTLLFQLINIARAIVEKRRPWMILRKTDTSKTVSATSSSAWNTSINLATITDLARFNDSNGAPIRLFDGNQTFWIYRLRPFEDRLRYIQAPGTACYDEVNKLLYLNGNIPFAGTLHIQYIRDTGDIDDDSTWAFPSYAHPLLVFMAVAINKGGIDFDDIHARMSADNRATAITIMELLEREDNEKQLATIGHTDPYDHHGDMSDFRSGAINID